MKNSNSLATKLSYASSGMPDTSLYSTKKTTNLAQPDQEANKSA